MDILTPLEEEEFTAGLETGVVAFGLVAVLVVLLRRRRPLPLAGYAFGAAAMVALESTHPPPRGVLVGLVVMTGGGYLVEALRAPRWLGVFPALVGAWTLAYAEPRGVPDVAWIRQAVWLTAGLAAPLTAELDRRHRYLGTLLLPITVGGVYTTVPDTEEILVLLGAAAPLVLFGGPKPLASLGAGGSYGATGLVIWTVARGGRGRDSAIVGGLGCLGLLVLEPLARGVVGLVRKRGTPPQGWWTTAVPMAVVHGVVVFMSARVAGLQRDGVATAVVLVVTGAVAALLLLIVVMASASSGSGARRR